MCFILAQLNIIQSKARINSNVTGYRNANGHLILKGIRGGPGPCCPQCDNLENISDAWLRFHLNRIELVIRKYINNFVRCRTCKSPDTTLNKRDRLHFLKCSICQS